MQNGDLAVIQPVRWIIVLEGVLALVVQEHTKRWLRHSMTYHIMWHEVPLKRIVVLKERFPATHLEIVSFLDQGVIDQAAAYLDNIDVPYDSVSYWDIGEFTEMLRFNTDIRAIYDSDPENLFRFGQLGVAVVRGNDF